MLDNPEVVFARIAGSKGWLDEAQVETLFGLQSLDRMMGRRRTIAGLSVSEGMLSREQAAEIAQRVRYYLVRQADLAYGRVAAERGFVARATVDGVLADQRRAFQERRILQRLSRILLVAGALTPEQDEEVKAAILGRLAPASAAAPVVPDAVLPPEFLAAAETFLLPGEAA